MNKVFNHKSKMILLIAIFFYLAFTSCVQKETISIKTEDLIEVERLSDRIILIRMGVGYYEAVTAIATQKGIVVIDAGISNSLTARFRSIIEREFNRDDFTYLINTHSHPDHIGGNQVFSDAVIVGHENCLAGISENPKSVEKVKSQYSKIVEEYETELKSLDPGSEKWRETLCQKTRYRMALNDLSNDRIITMPSVTFNDQMNIRMGDISLNLFYFGRAHSESDILIHIPETKLLLTGDLFFPGGRPSIRYYDKKDVERWMKAIQWIKINENDIDKVIGGHGQIMTRSDLESFNGFVGKKWTELQGK